MADSRTFFPPKLGEKNTKLDDQILFTFSALDLLHAWEYSVLSNFHSAFVICTVLPNSLIFFYESWNSFLIEGTKLLE